jgi:hypothetical protein
MRKDYSTALKQHLSQYKVSRIQVTENGIWRRNKKPYSHILPFKHQELNLLETFRQPFWDYFAKAGIKLQRDFHHLNSSQAICFNLFFPFMSDENAHLQLLSDVFRHGWTCLKSSVRARPRFDGGHQLRFLLDGSGASIPLRN